MAGRVFPADERVRQLSASRPTRRGRPSSPFPRAIVPGYRQCTRARARARARPVPLLENVKTFMIDHGSAAPAAGPGARVLGIAAEGLRSLRCCRGAAVRGCEREAACEQRAGGQQARARRAGGSGHQALPPDLATSTPSRREPPGHCQCQTADSCLPVALTSTVWR